MNYQTFKPHPDLRGLVKFYWTLEVPYDPKNEKQKIIPDGCVEMTFNLKDKIRRYTSEKEYILHPPAMVMGQRTKSYYIEPTGDVASFAVCFYPYGFANFLTTPLKSLTDKETALEDLFGKRQADQLEQSIIEAESTEERIRIIEEFLFNKLGETTTTNAIVQNTIDALMESNGNTSINHILKDIPSKRRQLERKFASEIGISPKQLGKVIRLQSALKIMLNEENESLTQIAYESEYYDQAHFIKDFKTFIGVRPSDFLDNKNMQLSTLFYKED